MNFSANKTPVEIIKEGAFGGTYFRDIYKKSWKEFNALELSKKAKEKYGNNSGKEKAAKYYKDNKDVLKEKARNKYKDLTEEEKEFKRQYSKNWYNKLKENYKKL